MLSRFYSNNAKISDEAKQLELYFGKKRNFFENSDSVGPICF